MHTCKRSNDDNSATRLRHDPVGRLNAFRDLARDARAALVRDQSETSVP